MNIEFPLRVEGLTDIVDFLGRPVAFVDVPHQPTMDQDEEVAELIVKAVNHYVAAKAALDELTETAQLNGEYD